MSIKNITYLKVDRENISEYIYLDHYSDDLSIEQTANFSEEPIDAILGASLQEKAVVDMVSVGIAGSFSSRNPGRNIDIPGGKVLFNNGNRRIESIIEWFEKALEDLTVFTICKKGNIYHNQLLNSVKWTFDDSASQVKVSLSFIEVVFLEREYDGELSTVSYMKKPLNKRSQIESKGTTSLNSKPFEVLQHSEVFNIK